MIIITRPGQEGLNLVQQLQKSGFAAQHLPLFEIKTTLNLTQLYSHLALLQSNDAIIAVSPQIPLILNTFRSSISLPNHVRYFAIGKKTAHLLQHHVAARIYFPENENSEGLLQHPLLQRIAGTRTLILRGTSGREVLATHLSKRGTTVHYLSCYQRIPISYMPIEYEKWPKETMITITNGEGLFQLNHLIPLLKRSNFRLIVSSDRIGKLAKTHNWVSVNVSKSANNQILFKTIRTLCHNKWAEDSIG